MNYQNNTACCNTPSLVTLNQSCGCGGGGETVFTCPSTVTLGSGNATIGAISNTGFSITDGSVGISFLPPNLGTSTLQPAYVSGSLNVGLASSVSIAGVNVGTSPTQLPNISLTQGIIIYNTTGIVVYLGTSSSLTTSNGVPLAIGASLNLSISNANLIWVVRGATAGSPLFYIAT